MKKFLFFFGVVLLIFLFGASLYLYKGGYFEKKVYVIPPVESALPGETFSTFGAMPALAHAEFFESTKQKFIDAHTEFIEADLSRMQLRVYGVDGVKLEVPIMTKGKEGLWWQTPAGLYKVELKSKKHFSSFGHVYENWNLAFQGNFFIHGWPYYEDGKPVASQFSGGCIRLSDEDAKKVYDLVKVGTPVLVYEKSFTSDDFVYHQKPPEISGSSYLVADVQNNHVLLSSHEKDVRPIASITKLVTALVASEYINLDKDIVVRGVHIASTSLPRLHAGETHSAYSLLFPLLTESSNEAGEVLTAPLGRSYFISLMNKKVLSIGMASTTLVDPSGREAGNISTAEDLFALAKYIYLNRSFILHVTSDTLSASSYQNEFTNLRNFNLYKGDTQFIGGKIGKSTSAAETYVGVFSPSFGGVKRTLVFVVLGSSDIKKDIDTLREYVSKTYGEDVTQTSPAPLSEEVKQAE